MVANCRQRIEAIDTIAAVDLPPMAWAAADWAALRGPGTIACIALAQGCKAFWQGMAAAKRAGVAWFATAAAGAVA